MSAPERLTGTEVRLAERYVWVLDFVSRCAQAVDHGDWFYLYDKASQLEDAAGRLARVAGEAWQEVSAGKPPPPTQPCARRWRGTAATTAPAGCCTPPSRPGRGGEPR